MAAIEVMSGESKQNKEYMKILIDDKFGSTPSFSEYYYRNTTTPYDVIKQMYRNFGFIEQMAFPNTHQDMLLICSRWKTFKRARNTNLKYDNFYMNRQPCDFMMMVNHLQKAELLIYFIQVQPYKLVSAFRKKNTLIKHLFLKAAPEING